MNSAYIEVHLETSLMKSFEKNLFKFLNEFLSKILNNNPYRNFFATKNFKEENRSSNSFNSAFYNILRFCGALCAPVLLFMYLLMY